MICVYDIETYPNIFTFVFYDVGKKEWHIFEISERKNELEKLRAFLKIKGLKLVGYNCVYFDYPILHFILNEKNVTLESLYNYVDTKIIPSKFNLIPDWNIQIPQCDLYKINHYDNSARRTSLKWLEFTMRWKKVQDLPFDPGTVIPLQKFDDLIKYNINDVEFTTEFFFKCMDAIVFRKNMSKELGINVMNYSDVKIGEYINRKTYEKLSGIPYDHFKDLRTQRNTITVNSLIPDYVEFKSDVLRNFLKEISNKSFTLDEPFERHISLGHLQVKFAKGGLHSEDSPKVFKCAKGWVLKEKDVGSMYPASLINGKFYPEHLGISWNKGIKRLYDERLDKIKPEMKKWGYDTDEYKYLNSKQLAYKLAMNGGGYGKTGSEFSWQYDPLIMLKVTFKGQLSLLMLIEDYLLSGVDVISANTDGVVIYYKKEHEKLVQEIHDNWEKTTKYLLEDTLYSQIIFRDVNNYIAEIIDDSGKTIKIKQKGCFEIEQEYHKNNSQRIVAIALTEYFIHNVPIRDVIMNPGYKTKSGIVTSIYDYCKGVKKGANTSHYTMVGKSNINLFDKVIRFYISSNGGKLYKVYTSGKVEAVSKGFNTTLFMEYKEDNYDIYYPYYINECMKIIENIERGESKDVTQLSLFN